MARDHECTLQVEKATNINQYMSLVERIKELNKEKIVRSGIWTHALFRRPELESGALDHSAILTLWSSVW